MAKNFAFRSASHGFGRHLADRGYDETDVAKMVKGSKHNVDHVVEGYTQRVFEPGFKPTGGAEETKKEAVDTVLKSRGIRRQ